MRIGVSNPASGKIHFRIVEIAYLVIVSFHRGKRLAEGRLGNAWRILQVKQDEDEWTKGSFRQMKDEGTRYREGGSRQKRNGIGDLRRKGGTRSRWPYSIFQIASKVCTLPRPTIKPSKASPIRAS